MHSYLPPTWDVSVEAALDAVVTTTGLTTGTAPGFVDGPAFDFHLLPNATVRNGGAALAGGVPSLLLEYVAHQATAPRNEDGPLDLGAFEVCEGDCEPVVAPDGGVTPIGDGGVPPIGDGGAGTDGGTEPGDGRGCGCSVQRSSSSPWVVLGLLGLVGVRRARRLRVTR